MKERPILMNEFSVRATLEDLKTNTRRVMKDLPDSLQFHTHRIRKAGEDFWVAEIQLSPELQLCSTAPGGWALVRGGIRCPYGVPGDRLWVRETWATYEARGCSGGVNEYTAYRATHDGDPPIDRWKPSIHMPRWASRLLLEVKDVRVERVQEISPEDCEAEGITGVTLGSPIRKQPYEEYRNGDGLVYTTPRDAFAALWDEINAKRGYSWQSNPWTWVVDFKWKQMK